MNEICLRLRLLMSVGFLFTALIVHAADLMPSGPKEEITRGRLHFSSCLAGDPDSVLGTFHAYCSHLTVQEDRHLALSSDRIDLSVVLLPSRSDEPEADAVIFLAGGPGQAASDAYPAAASFFESLRTHRDVVLVDQRGTGRSHPLLCPEKDAFGDSGIELSAAKENEESPGQRQEAARKCLDFVRKSSRPEAYTTTESAADLNEVAQAMGIPSLTLVGVSYGTRLAQQFARTYPFQVRALVLDSALPNDAALGADTGIHLDDALTARWNHCQKTPECKTQWGNPMATLRTLDDALKIAPRKVRFRDPVSNEEREDWLTSQRLQDTVRLAAYAPETASLLAWWIGRASAGDASALMSQGAQAESELTSLSRNVLQLSVLCSEDTPSKTASPEELASLLGSRPREALLSQCEVWPKGKVPSDFHAPFISAIPALVLQGEWDPATPPDYGHRVVKGLSKSQLLLVPGGGHNVLVRGCMPKLVARFIDTLRLPLDVSCLDRMGPLPDFISVQGPAP